MPPPFTRPLALHLISCPVAFRLSCARPNLLTRLQWRICILASPDLPESCITLLEALRALPAMPNIATLTNCPRTLTRRFAQLVASSFLFQHLSIDCSTQHVQLFSLLAYSPDAAPEASDRPSARSVVADRITRAEAQARIVCERNLATTPKV